MDFHLSRADDKLKKERRQRERKQRQEAAAKRKAAAVAKRAAQQSEQAAAAAAAAQSPPKTPVSTPREAQDGSAAPSQPPRSPQDQQQHPPPGPFRGRQLCFRGNPPALDRLNRQQIEAGEPELARACGAANADELAAVMLGRFGTDGAHPRKNKRSDPGERRRRGQVCSALRLGLLAQQPQERAFPLALAVVERLARSSTDGERRSPQLPICLTLDALLATALPPTALATQVAAQLAEMAMRSPAWFSLGEPEVEPEPEPEP